MLNKLEDDVRSAYARANEGAAHVDELLTAVRVFVRNLKSEGRPPENVIVTVKKLCGVTHMTAAADTDSSVDGSDSKKLSDIVVSTVIHEYYATSSVGRRHPRRTPQASRPPIRPYQPPVDGLCVLTQTAAEQG